MMLGSVSPVSLAIFLIYVFFCCFSQRFAEIVFHPSGYLRGACVIARPTNHMSALVACKQDCVGYTLPENGLLVAAVDVALGLDIIRSVFM